MNARSASLATVVLAVLLAVLLVATLLGACATADEADTADDQALTQPGTATSPAEVPEVEPDDNASAAPEPQPFVPSGPVGDANAYQALIDELEAHVPAELRASVPWPDLRNPDPTVAQREIFALWIWMLENYPDPRLIDAITAPDSPDRASLASTFGSLALNGYLRVRFDAPYRAFDQTAVEWESADVPSWLRRDVPEPAVLIYYRDESGPSTTVDAATNTVIEVLPAPGLREWVAVMVETDVGWLLWRDTQLNTSEELTFPEFIAPSDNSAIDRRPNV